MNRIRRISAALLVAGVVGVAAPAAASALTTITMSGATASYPLVRNLYAFSTRFGVSRRPSRVGSSPNSASSFLIRSCILLFYIPALGAQSADALYADRANLASARSAAEIWRAQDTFDAAWKLARADYCFALPAEIDDLHAAPLLCAGLIGYRALRMAGDAARLGIYGFGAAAHLIAQIAVAQGRERVEPHRGATVVVTAAR